MKLSPSTRTVSVESPPPKPSPPKVNPPGVSEMVRLIRRSVWRRELVALDSGDLMALVETDVDEETRMLASVLATMTAGQRKLLAWKAR